MAAHLTVPASAWSSDFNEKGRWDPAITGWDVMNGSNLESGGGTHMACCEAPLTARGSFTGTKDQQARLWQAQPMSNADPGVAVPYEGSNIFCGGHATLANGKLFVVGGTIAGVTGDKRAHTFDATRYWEASGGWALVDEAQQGQYYPTVTTLGDGKVLATGGGQWKNMVLVGGAVNSGGQPAAVNEMRLLNLAQVRNWSAEPPFATQPHSSAVLLAAGAAVAPARSGSVGRAVPQAFTLGQNEPNPFGRAP